MDINQSAVLNMPNQLYNVVITVHALLMIFYLIMPSLFGGFGNLFVPTLVGAIDMANKDINYQNAVSSCKTVYNYLAICIEFFCGENMQETYIGSILRDFMLNTLNLKG
jgi:cytochrome c oxidase subunit I